MTTRKKIADVLKRGTPVSDQGIANELGIHRSWAYKVLRQLHDDGRIHIAGFRRDHTSGCPIRLYTWGPGEDAKRPERLGPRSYHAKAKAEILRRFAAGERLSSHDLGRMFPGLSSSFHYETLRRMHREGAIHVCAWGPQPRSRPFPIFANGEGEDVPAPCGKPYDQYWRERKARLEANPDEKDRVNAKRRLNHALRNGSIKPDPILMALWGRAAGE